MNINLNEEFGAGKEAKEANALVNKHNKRVL
jgi:hypothetical protein